MEKEKLTVWAALLPVNSEILLQTVLQYADRKRSLPKVQAYYKMISHCYGVWV